MIPGVPYDAEIEYLESTGTQWIDTGVVFQYDWSTTLSMEADVQFKSSTSRYLFGSNGWGYWGKNASNKYESGGFGSGGGLTNLPSLDALGRHTVRWTFIGTGTAHRNEFSYDGENYVGATTTQDTAPQYIYPVILFGIGNRNTPQPSFLSMALLWGCSIYKNGVLVRDFIPVRVGQTGYMYDRVSKRLFGNAGTGSFVLGPDVAKPVMGLWGMKKITYVPSDYVTDGIVAWYDGEWNVGWNKHDANAQTWKDLSGEGNDATIVKRDTFDRSFTFDSNSCTMDGTFCWSFTASNSVINAVKGDCTIEIIRRLGTPSQQDSTPFFGLNVYNSRAMSMSGTPDTCKLKMGMNNEFHVANSTRPGISTTITKHIEGTTISNGFFEKGIQKGTGTYSTQAITVNSNGVLFGAGTNLFGGKGRYWEPNPPADGHAYTLRFYNRALSSAEIAHNYAIDKARFNLP